MVVPQQPVDLVPGESHEDEQGLVTQMPALDGEDEDELLERRGRVEQHVVGALLHIIYLLPIALDALRVCLDVLVSVDHLVMVQNHRPAA